MTTTWRILDAVRITSTGLIKKLIYKCEVQLENITYEKKGKVILQGTSLEFIPFQDLTEEILIEWVKNSLGAEQVTAIETTLQNKAISHNAPGYTETTQKGLPWSL
jgi:hypothetical protein